MTFSNSSSRVDPLAWIEEELSTLDSQKLRRVRSVRKFAQGRVIQLNGRDVLNFGSNDYLGLASDVRILEAVRQALEEEGWGSGASPLVCGRSVVHATLEKTLADFEACPAALLFPTGFAANMGTIAALVGPGDVVYCDRKNHASILDGCRLSRADFRVYPHCDMDALDRLLAKPHRHRRRLVVTDSLFSMDGDLAPLAQLVEICDRHGAMLMVDEAHATGVFGKQGRGVAELFHVESQIPVRIGTLSKALGSIGGFVAGSQMLIDWLVHKARPYMFSTALPAVAAHAALAALRIVQSEPHRGREVLTRAAWLRERLRNDGWDTGRSESQIVPVIVKTPEKALSLSHALFQRGIFAPAIRPPSVPEGEACIRISISYHHRHDDLKTLADAMADARHELEREGVAFE